MAERSSGGLSSALGLLTVIKGGPELRVEAVGWFPLVGAMLGTALGALWWGLGRLLPPLVAGALVLLADLVVTGLLHADGLIDAADGLLPHLDVTRRLQVMAEPQVGAFGVASAVALLGLRLAALGSALPESALSGAILLGAIWTASRSIMALAVTHLRYARDGGMAFLLTGGSSVSPVLGLVVAAGALAWWHLPAGLAVLGAEVASGGAVYWLAQHRLGGYTGDVLGAAGLVGETVALVVAVAKW
ncbi:MAG: adenosylcobinamide-GDP ribazoletransferase [Acidimicrobiales bacterium]